MCLCLISTDQNHLYILPRASPEPHRQPHVSHPQTTMPHQHLHMGAPKPLEATSTGVFPAAQLPSGSLAESQSASAATAHVFFGPPASSLGLFFSSVFPLSETTNQPPLCNLPTVHISCMFVLFFRLLGPYRAHLPAFFFYPPPYNSDEVQRQIQNSQIQLTSCPGPAHVTRAL